MDRSISNSASIRRTASIAMGEIDGRLLALRLAPRARLDVRQDEELAAGVRPARRLGIGPGCAPGVIELAVAAIGVGLQDAGVARQMPLGMLARRSRE